jgi:cytochrome c oxidase subunit 3
MSPLAGRDGDGSPRVVRPAGERGAPVPGAGALGLTWFLVSLGVLFAASVVAYVVVRSRAATWGATEHASRGGLAMATVLLVATATACHRGLVAIRGGRSRGLLAWLGIALAAALSFLAVQGWNWARLWESGAVHGPGLSGFTFLMLTGLHALHVVGGIAFLVHVLYRARRGAYTWAHYPGVRHCAVYWHFLDAVWLVLLAVLLLT